MDIETFELTDGTNVTVAFSKTRLPTERGSVLIVTVRGRTGIGCGSNGDAAYIEAMARAALCMIQPSALVFDFREFEYEWGDMMAATLGAGDQQYVDSEFPTAVVVSDLCRKGLTSLVSDEMFAKPDDWLFESLESAVDFVDRRRRELLNQDKDRRGK